MSEQSFVVLNKLDKTSIACSGACAVHCLLLPVIAYISPTIADIAGNELIHIGLILALLPLALLAFTKSYKKHKNFSAGLLGGIGILFLLSAVALESLHIENLEKILTGAGSVILIIAHTINMKLLNH